jgi:Zn-dependent metalloprotease
MAGSARVWRAVGVWHHLLRSCIAPRRKRASERVSPVELVLQWRAAMRRGAALAGAVALVTSCTSDRSDQITTEPVHYLEVATTRVGPDLETAALDYVAALEPDLAHVIISVAEADGLWHVRLQQVHEGVPVAAGEVIVHADDTTFLGLNGVVTRHLDGFDVTPAITDSGALDIARADHGGAELSDERSALVIRPDDDGSGAALVWRVVFTSPATGSREAGIWNHHVDAQDGRVVERWNALATLEQASGAGGNPKKANSWTSALDVEVESDDGQGNVVYKMDSPRFLTVNRQDGDMVIKGPLAAMPDASANDAHGYAEVTLDMMKNWMGRDSIDDKGFKIKSRVHDTDACAGAPNNACWDGTQMTYGDGGPALHPLSGGLDVVAHELNHGFTTFHSNLEYKEQSGGLNESFSDVAGTIAEFYREGEAADFLIGEDIVKNGEAARWMCEPARDGRSIAHVKDFKAGMDVHFSSGVPNRVFCLSVARFRTVGTGATTLDAVKQLGRIWYTANGGFWTSGSDFAQACKGIVDAARSLGYKGEAVEALTESWADTGVQCDHGSNICNRNAACELGEGETCTSCPDDCGNCADPCSPWKKEKCKLGIGDCSQCDQKPSGCGDGMCTGDETDATCAADCGCAASQCSQVAPFGCYCDGECSQRGDCCSDAGTCGGA